MQAQGWTPVAAGVSVWVMPQAAMNCVVVADGGEALVVDPGTLPSLAHRTRRAVEARGDRIVGVALTHAHWDHCLALEAYDDVPSWAHPAVVAEVAERGEATRRAAADHVTRIEPAAADVVREVEQLRVVAPTRAVGEACSVRVGAWEVLLEPMGAAHTAGDLVVHVPAAGVSIVGDLVETAGDPQRDETTDVEGWLRALDRLEAGAQPLLVPGHGPPCGHERIARHRRLLRDWRQEASRSR